MTPTNPIQLPKETLLAIKAALPHGSIEKIAVSTGYSRQYVHKIFSGEVKINHNSIKIIEAAQKIIRNAKNEYEAMIKRLSKNA